MGHNWSLGIGLGHQLVAQLGGTSLGGAERPLTILAFVVSRASVRVRLAVPQHGVNDAGQLVDRGRDGLRYSQLGLLPAQKGTQGADGAMQRVGGQTQSRRRLLALGLVFGLMTLPPVTRLSGLSPSQEAKWPALGHFDMSVPISLSTFRAVKPSTPSIRVRSTPVIRYRGDLSRALAKRPTMAVDDRAAHVAHSPAVGYKFQNSLNQFVMIVGCAFSSLNQARARGCSVADPQHIEWLLEGVDAWNSRRVSMPFAPFLMNADIYGEFNKRGMLDHNGRVRLNRFDLRDANLAGSDLRNTDFSEAVLRRSKLYSARLDDTDFDRADLTDAEFGIVSLSHSRFPSSTLDNADLVQTHFADADLGWSQLWTAKVFPDGCVASQFDANVCRGHPISGLSSFLEVFEAIERQYGSDVVYYFRGESKVGWALRPSVMRPEPSTDDHVLRASEGRMLTDLMARRPEEFVGANSAVDEWVISQHHGLSTRFLDITKDPRIALFNACGDAAHEEATGLVYIFAVPRCLVKPFNDETVSVISNFAKLSRSDQNTILTKNGTQMAEQDPTIPIGCLYPEALRRLCKLVQEERPPFEEAMIDVRDFFRVLVVEPRQTNERLRAQSGAFLLSAFHERFEREQILKWNAETPVYANYTLTIPPNRKATVIRELSLLNVRRETLFPGLDSSAAAIIESYRQRPRPAAE